MFREKSVYIKLLTKTNGLLLLFQTQTTKCSETASHQYVKCINSLIHISNTYGSQNMLYLSLLLACSNTDAPSGKDVVMKVQRHASPKSDDFRTMSFECCDTKEARKLLDQYLFLTRAMAADDTKDQEGQQTCSLYKHPEFATYSKPSYQNGLKVQILEHTLSQRYTR